MTDGDHSRDPVLDAEESPLGWITCPACGKHFKLSDRHSWSGIRHTRCGQRLNITNVAGQPEPVWCMVANVSDQAPFGPDAELHSGTKHFSAGTKVYCYPPLWGDGYENVRVIGRHRGSKRYVVMVIPSKRLTNCRARPVYSPYLLDRLSGYWDNTERSKKLAVELAEIVNSRNTGIRPDLFANPTLMKPKANVAFCDVDLAVDDIGSDMWSDTPPVPIASYWNGDEAPAYRHAQSRLLWSENSLYVRFDCRQAEPLVLNDNPQTKEKTMQLWERDVCELFLAPDRNTPGRYAEFEIAPTGEWLDLMVDWRNAEPRDWDYRSGMETFARIEPESVTMIMKIPWTAFDRKPAAGDVWVGNLFRQVGSGDTRGYLAWSPTLTSEPQFHVPDKFGEFVFQSG